MANASKPLIEPTVRIRSDQSVGVLDIVEVYRHRILLGQMVRRQFILRVASSPTSFVWGFVRPTVMTLAFHYLRRVSSADFGQEVPYSLYIFSGFALWFLFQETVMQVAGSLSTDAAVIRKLYYPRILSPLAIIISRLFDFAVILIAIVIFQLWLGVAVSPTLLFILPVAAVYFALAFGLGTVFSALMLYHPDTKRILEVILYLGVFLSPVVFSKSILPPTVQEWFALNPMVGILGGARASLFSPVPMDFTSFGISAGVAAVLLAAGLWMLSRAARVAAERL